MNATQVRRPAIVIATGVLALLAGCEREHRDFTETPPAATASSALQVTDIHAGPGKPDASLGAYQENRWAVGEGKRLFDWYNCSGCHSPGGGGGIGPALTDREWRYGSDPENIFDTIIEGRPLGMPSFRGRVSNADAWKLVTYVRSLSGFTPIDARTPRSDNMAAAQVKERAYEGRPDSVMIPPESFPPGKKP